MYKNTIAVVTVLVLVLTGLFGGSHYQSVRAIEDSRSAITMLNAVATGTVTLGSEYGTRCRESAIYVSWSAGTSAGVVTIETANTSGYAGTWAPITTVAWTAVSKQDVVQLTGVYESVRTRISTNIVGGTVSTYFVCN